MTPSNLLGINVNKHTEAKNGLTYLSWVWAWDQILRADPQANYDVKMFGDLPYMKIGDTAMVWVTVTVFGKSVTVQLPVMNNKNDPISIAGRSYKDKWGNERIEIIDSFNVNTAIMRCLTKGIAMHGLGLYIYAGEDLPMEDEKEAPKAQPKAPPKEEPKAEPVKLVVQDEQGAPVAEVELTTDNATTNEELFAAGMIKFTGLCDNLKDLNSYWKNNQTQIDKLKVSHPDLYVNVRNAFSELKKKFSQPKE